MAPLAFLLFLSQSCQCYVPTLPTVLVKAQGPQAFTLTQATSGVIPDDVLIAINNNHSPPHLTRAILSWDRQLFPPNCVCEQMQ